ncbi:coiled-coil domain-containing protein 186-like [Palaemon carinicauda]|uniref:coiled-coil domain-containing protein 186-like n=1 Tax=Palaemon carinicauda TaxID=392227 RepID=UPI0035B6107F
MLKLLNLQILSLVLLASVYVQGQGQEINDDLSSRLSKVEEVLASNIASQENLRVALRQETAKRLELETRLSASLRDHETKLDDLSSTVKVMNDHVSALDRTIQDEIRLREEAELKGEKAILDLSKKIGLIEVDLSLLALMNSRLRELENQKGVQTEEILNLQSTISQFRKMFHREQKATQKLDASIEPLAYVTSEHTKSIAEFDHRINQLKSWLISQNETAWEESTMLRNVKSDMMQIRENLADVEMTIANLTESVIYLHHLTPKKLLKLCPNGYRKVGEDCLQLIESRTSWEMSRLKCEELGILAGGIGDLAVPNSLPEFRTFIDKINPESDYLWVGASRDSDGIWRWVTGATLEEEEFPWDLAEPDNYDNQYQLCVKSVGNIKFHDCLADAKIGAVCQLV